MSRPLPIHRMTQRIDDEVADDDPRRHDFAAPPGERSQAGEQLAEIERLGQVVVGAGIEAGDSLLHRVERGEHQNGHLIPALSNGATDDDPALSREQDVENDRVVLVRRGERQGLRAGARRIDGKRGLAKPPHDRRPQLAIVFGKQNAHGP